jgi:hypothetical protein
MSLERHDALVDELEQELRQALAVEPSPDFARGVRSRIERVSSRRTPAVLRWEFALAAAAVCVFAIAIGWRFGREDDTPATSLETRVGADVELAAPRVEAVLPPPSVTRAPSRYVRAASTDEPVTPAEPEVIVPPDRAEGLARFLALTRSGAVDEEILRPIAPPQAPAKLDVAPLVVPAISVAPVDIPNGPTGSGGD